MSNVGEAAQHANPWLERLARLGYVAEGTVYVVVGTLAIGVAVGGVSPAARARGEGDGGRREGPGRGDRALRLLPEA